MRSHFIDISGSEGTCRVYKDSDEFGVFYEFIADADIDADGANGQFGGRAAYRADNTGSELLENGGMKRHADGSVWFAADWGKDIVIMNDMGQPRVFANGSIASKTAYRLPGKSGSDPEAYIDSETIPYIVIPPILRQKTQGVVLGCYAEALNLDAGLMAKPVPSMVADIGPRTKTGEISIFLARQLGIPSSPRTGGTNKRIVRYRFWPSRQYTQNGFTYPLLPA